MMKELMVNAIEHARSTVAVSIKKESADTIFEVRNDFKKTPVLENVDVPFFTTQGPQRTRLGLAAVRGMAESLGAQFNIDVVGQVVCAQIRFKHEHGRV